ncbi:recombinase [Geobacter sp. OR-1]|nr:recombinase [Geobacter sp. OR-1]
MYIEPIEAAIIKRIFEMYDSGMALTRIGKVLNNEKIPSCKQTDGGWNESTVRRILKNEKYTGLWVWGKLQNKRNPITGAIRQVPRDKPLHTATHEDLRIIPQELWDRVQKRLVEFNNNGTSQVGKAGGFPTKQVSKVHTFPHELLSGAMVCDVCGNTIGKVTGKGGGYYGCMKAVRGGCTNKLMVRKSIVEPIIMGELAKLLNNTEMLKFIMTKVEKYVKEMCSTVPEEIVVKKTELSKLDKVIHNLVKFISDGRSSKSIADSLQVSEERKEVLSTELVILEATHMKVFKAPPIEWITDRVSNIKEVLEEKTEQSALLIRKLMGQIRLKPVTPDIGRAYLVAISKFQPLALFEEKRPSPKKERPLSLTSDTDWDGGTNARSWWRCRESNPGPKVIHRRRLHACTSF